MRRLTKAQWRALGVEPPKTAAQMRAEDRKKAKALPVETKRVFWQAILDGKNLGEARTMVGIDLDTAGELYLQCHERITYDRPKRIDEIK